MIEVKIGANLFKYSQNWDPRPLAYHVLSWFSSSWYAGIFVLLNWRVFFISQAYANVLKGNMDGLKKKDKRSATKSKSKATQ